MSVPRLTFWTDAQAVGLEALRERLSQAVHRAGPDECWLYTGKTTRGYGRITVKGKQFLTHRLAWTLANQSDPGPLLVCHTCDNPPCCNPKHLFLGTVLDNSADMKAKGRSAVRLGETRKRKRGLKLTVEQVASIRRDVRPDRIVAEEYGVSKGTIWKIRSGFSWTGRYSGSLVRQPKGGFKVGEDSYQAKLTNEQVLAIVGDNRSLREIGLTYGVSDGAIQAIKCGRTWSKITGIKQDRACKVQPTPHVRLSGASYYLPSEGVGEGHFSDSDVRLANVLNFPHIERS